jgi:hypothetical protein
MAACISTIDFKIVIVAVDMFLNDSTTGTLKS